MAAWRHPAISGKRDGAAKRGLVRCVLIGTWLLFAGVLGACGTPSQPTAVAAAGPLQPATLRLPALPRLTGLSPTELVALFGEPDFRRTEPPAELWQYRSAECVLDIFLYRGTAGAHVLHSEMRGRGLIEAGAGTCRGNAFANRIRESRL